MERKIESVQIMRGVAALSVVVFHIWGAELKYCSSGRLLPDILYAGIFGVDLFFVISGFVMFMISRQSFQDQKKVRRFIYRDLCTIQSSVKPDRELISSGHLH